MANKKWFGIFLIFLILLSCCIEKEKIKLKYVCYDSSIVSDPRECPVVEKEKINVTKYVCVDGKIAELSSECELSATTTTSGEEMTANDIMTTTQTAEEYTTTEKIVTTTKAETTTKKTTTTAKITTTTPTTTTTTTTQISTTTTHTTTTTESETTTTTVEETASCTSFGCPEGTQFVGLSGGTKYHYCWCSYMKGKTEGIICFTSKEDAQSKGYTACSRCKPPS